MQYSGYFGSNQWYQRAPNYFLCVFLATLCRLVVQDKCHWPTFIEWSFKDTHICIMLSSVNCVWEVLMGEPRHIYVSKSCNTFDMTISITFGLLSWDTNHFVIGKCS